MNISFNILLRVAEASLERKLSDLSARSPKHLHTLNSEGPTSSIPDQLGTNEAPLKVVGKTTLLFRICELLGCTLPKANMEPEEENHLPNPDVGVQLRFFFFLGGGTNYIIS